MATLIDNPLYHVQSFKTSVVLSPMLTQQLHKLCDHYGESQSQVMRRLIIDMYARLATKLGWELYERA